MITAVKTDPSQRHEGISLLIIERGMEGFERGRNLDKVGMHAQDTAELFFHGRPRAGGEPARRGGQGFRYMTANLAQERLSIAIAGGRGGARGAGADARVRQGAHRLRPADRLVSELAVRAGGDGDRDRAGDDFCDQAVLALNAGELSPEDAAMAKWWSTELQGR